MIGQHQGCRGPAPIVIRATRSPDAVIMTANDHNFIWLIAGNLVEFPVASDLLRARPSDDGRSQKDPSQLLISILIMNAITPLLSRYTRPKVFGSENLQTAEK